MARYHLRLTRDAIYIAESSTLRRDQADLKPTSFSRRQKVKPGKAFSPCPRPQPGRRPLDFVRPIRQKRNATPSPPPSLSLSDNEVAIEHVVAVPRKLTSSRVLAEARKARRGIWTDQGSSCSTASPPSEPSPVFNKKVGRQRKYATSAGHQVGLADVSKHGVKLLPDSVALVTNVAAPRPRAIYPYMAPPSIGRRRIAAPLASSQTANDVGKSSLATDPATSPLAERPTVQTFFTAFPAIKDEEDEQPIPIRIPTPFSRPSTPLARAKPSVQSVTPAALGHTVRSTITLSQTLRGRASMSATISASPEKIPEGKKRTRSLALADDDKEDIGEVIQRLSKKARGPPTAAVSPSSFASGNGKRSSPAGPSGPSPIEGRILSTFKAHRIVKAMPSSSEATLTTADPPPYLATPRWFMPPNAYYFAPYPLPQRPVLGLQGWQKPNGTWPPGGGNKEPTPLTAGKGGPHPADSDEVDFLREISFGGF